MMRRISSAALLPAFDLDHFRSRFFHETGGVPHRVAGIGLIRPEWHVAHQQRMLYAAMRGPGVVQHFVERDRKRVLVPQHGLGQRIADQNDIDPGLIDQARGWNSRTR